MKNVFLIILYFLLIFKGNAQGLSSSTNDYNYTSYSSIYKNENISGTYITSTSARESILYVTSTGITITNANLDKMIGDLADKDIKDSEFYGVNAAVLVNGGEVTITKSLIATRVKGSNAVCATNSGTVTISDATVTTSGTASSRGLYATYGGTITASGVTISTMWKSCATLSTDRGGGTVSCTGCTLSTMDSGSPFIYSGGTTSIITVSGTTGRQSASQCVVVEGKNTAIVQDRSNLKCTGKGNTGDADNSGIFLYQSMSGDADVGTTTFTCTNSKFEIDSYSSVYDSVPIFSITNTEQQ